MQGGVSLAFIASGRRSNMRLNASLKPRLEWFANSVLPRQTSEGVRFSALRGYCGTSQWGNPWEAMDAMLKELVPGSRPLLQHSDIFCSQQAACLGFYCKRA